MYLVRPYPNLSSAINDDSSFISALRAQNLQYVLFSSQMAYSTWNMFYREIHCALLCFVFFHRCRSNVSNPVLKLLDTAWPCAQPKAHRRSTMPVSAAADTSDRARPPDSDEVMRSPTNEALVAAPDTVVTTCGITTTNTDGHSVGPTRSISNNDNEAAPSTMTVRPTPKRPSAEQAKQPTDNRSDLEVLRSKWQMASCAHFVETFRDVLPLADISADTASDLTPVMLEYAIAEPEIHTMATLAFRDVVMCLLVAIGAISRKGVSTQWFQALRLFVSQRPKEFHDCFVNGECILAHYDNGMDFLVGVQWPVRLGLLLGLCDIAAEEAVLVRESIREGELATANSKTALEERGVRLAPVGRCSLRRTHYKVGKTRIYSGYRRKGCGSVVIECSDSQTMLQFSEALSGSKSVKDQRLGAEIKDKFVAPLIELEERQKRKMDRLRQAEIEREESRRRNSHRPRRSKARYQQV